MQQWPCLSFPLSTKHLLMRRRHVDNQIAHHNDISDNISMEGEPMNGTALQIIDTSKEITAGDGHQSVGYLSLPCAKIG